MKHPFPKYESSYINCEQVLQGAGRGDRFQEIIMPQAFCVFERPYGVQYIFC